MHPQRPLYRPERANVAALKKAFPEQFSDENARCGWPDSWHGLVESVCRAAHERQLPVVWQRIKEKFGGLRMYRAGGALRIDMIHDAGFTGFREGAKFQIDCLINNAEAESRGICMRCGRKGARHTVGRLVVTLCDADLQRYARDHERWERT